MNKTLSLIIALTAIIAPTLHIISDVIEWSDDFSRTQLLINYAGFLAMPFLMIGLYAAQHPKIGWLGLIGVILYAVSFIYFAHTTLLALEESLPNYETLWQRLGKVYTFHGGLMVAGGLLFGFAALKGGVLWQKGVILFIFGLLLNLLLTFLPLPDIFQTIGSTIRNLGLIGIGLGLLGADGFYGKSPSNNPIHDIENVSSKKSNF